MTQPSHEAAHRPQPDEYEPLLARSDSDGSETVAGSPNAHDQIDKSSPAVTLRNETRILLHYSGPMILTYLLQYGYQLVIILVASQLSTDELAGVSLGMTTSNIIGYAVFEGMATALDTLCSHAYGASRLSDVGMHTIRFTVFIHLVAIPIALLWLFSEQLILLLNVPSTALAAYAGSFLRFSLIGIPGYATFEAGKRFMQAQGNFTAGFYVLLLCLPINISLTWVLVKTANMRVAGAALAASLTNTLRPLLLAAYAIWINRSTLKCWPCQADIATEWRKEWGVMVRLAIPGAVMTIGEWLCFEILTFCTSYVGVASLAAQTFLSSTATLVWHIPFSASIACTTRIGQLVGAGHSDLIATLMKWYAFVFLILGLLDSVLQTGLILLMLKYLVHDPQVAHIIKITLPYTVGFVVFDSTSNWPHSIVRGFGWQSIGAWVTVVVNYGFAVPLSIFLELGPPYMGIRGLWIGLGSGLFIITFAEAIIIWIKMKRGASARVENLLSDEDDIDR